MSEREIETEVQSFKRAIAAINSQNKASSLNAAAAQLDALRGAENPGIARDVPRVPEGDFANHAIHQIGGQIYRQGHYNYGRTSGGGDAATQGKPFRRLCALVTTEAPLRAVNKDLLPLAPTVLINYDIPVRKEDYVKRIASVLGGRSRAEGQRLSINFLEAGKVGELRQLEEFAEKEVQEMPVHVADVFQSIDSGKKSVSFRK